MVLAAYKLTAHNWQKGKRVFFSCYYHEIYRVELVGLKIPIILNKIQFLWICEIWGNFLKTQYFANNYLIKVWIWEFFCTHVTHVTMIIVIIFHTFYQIELYLNTDFLWKFCALFIAKWRSVTLRCTSQENACASENSKHPSPFLRKTKGSSNSFTPVENNFRF